MKFRNDKDRWLQNTSNQNMSLLAALWVSMLATIIYKSTKPKPTDILIDERTRRTTEKAAHYVLLRTLVSLLVVGSLYLGFPRPKKG